MCVCVLLHHEQLFATPWTVALQAPLSVGSLQARKLEWVATSSFGGSSRPRDRPTSLALQADSSLLSHWERSRAMLSAKKIRKTGCVDRVATGVILCRNFGQGLSMRPFE